MGGGAGKEGVIVGGGVGGEGEAVWVERGGGQTDESDMLPSQFIPYY